MTAPAPVAPYEPYTVPPEQDSPVVEAVVVALTAYFASQAAISAVLLPAQLIGQLTAIGIAPKPARAAGKLALAVPMTGRSRYGAPSLPETTSPLDAWSAPTAATPPMARRAAADEPLMRARYVLNASRRLTDHLVHGRFLPGLRAERHHLRAHVRAGRNRQAAARRLDEVAEREGPFLRWDTTLDERTTPDCRALHGTVFTLDNPPGIPGAMHSTCRCRAVGAGVEAAPFPTAA